MLRLLSIRNFVLVESLDLELDQGFSVLTGETGAGKSILLDALGLLLGDRFELRQLRPGSERAELAAMFDVSDAPGVRAWLAESDLVDQDEDVLVRRVLDAQGRSRAFVNGHPVTLAQLSALGERLVDLHGQHAHQSLESADEQRALVDEFGGFSTLSREVGEAWRKWRSAVEQRDAAAGAAHATATERDYLADRARELAALGMNEAEWLELNATQSRLANASALIEAATQGEALLSEGDDALTLRLAHFTHKLSAASAHDPALAEILALLEPARIQLDEAARALRDYQRRLDLDPSELKRVEDRLAAIHDMARKHRVRPEALPALLAETQARLGALSASADAEALTREAGAREADYRALAEVLSKKRRYASNELSHKVTATLQELAMSGGRLEIALLPLEKGASHGLESIEFRVASHPKQSLGPLAKVASGGELSRIALAIQVVTSEVGHVPTLVFDEVDAGIGGAVAAIVGKLMQSLGTRRQVLCVTHLPQVAAFADTHYRVTKHGDERQVRSGLDELDRGERIEELARMLGGVEVTAKTRAHAKELYDQHRRPASERK
ncbi:MAG TPA: DNA repair protein RecN [Casimicrobiaceae bacterium]|nr:DNA repair protein RecN [Casimicrobiaceae bacterium]